MASNLLAEPNSDGLLPRSNGLQPEISGLQPSRDGLQPTSEENEMEFWHNVFLVGDVIFTAFFCLDVTVRIAIIRTLGSI